MKRALTPDELNGLEELGYNTSTYKGELVDFPDPELTSTPTGAAVRALVSSAIPATAGAAGGPVGSIVAGGAAGLAGDRAGAGQRHALGAAVEARGMTWLSRALATFFISLSMERWSVLKLRHLP